MSLSRRDILMLLIGVSMVLALVVGLAFPGTRGVASSSNPDAAYSLFWQVVASGGTPLTSTHYTMRSTAGQAAIGNLSSAHYKLHSGFWYSYIRLYLPTVKK